MKDRLIISMTRFTIEASPDFHSKKWALKSNVQANYYNSQPDLPIYPAVIESANDFHIAGVEMIMPKETGKGHYRIWTYSSSFGRCWSS